jgi:hypothetical protein
MLLGWRRHDIETVYLPFIHGVGIQIGTSDPVFMRRFNLPLVQCERPKWPYVPKEEDAKIIAGDEEAKKMNMLGQSYLRDCNSGKFKTWEDLQFLKDNWDGPIVLKGIQNVAVRFCVPDSFCSFVYRTFFILFARYYRMLKRLSRWA